MTEEQLADLTPREQALMRVLTEMLGTYRASSQREAANAMSQAISRAWQTLKPTEPAIALSEPQFRADDSNAMLTRVIDQLPEPQRSIMRLSRLKTWTVDAIAAELGMSVAEVEQHRGEAGTRPRATLAAAGRRKP